MADYNRSITVEDLLRRYNLEGLQRDRNKVNQLQGELTNTNGILEDFVDVTTQNMDLIKNQLDGNVTSWFYDYAPTLYNIPAVNWATDDVKKEHLEDLFYNTDTGKVYKFVAGRSTDNLYNPASAPDYYGHIDFLNHFVITNGTQSEPAHHVTYLSCQPNTTYTVNKLLDSVVFRIALTSTDTITDDKIPSNSEYWIGSPGSLEPVPTTTEITTGQNDYYLFIEYLTTSSLTADQIRNSISVYPHEGVLSCYWVEVTNIVGAQTLAVANASQDILDGNRRTFVVQPTPPYDVGDLWTDNTNHILYRCRTEKAAGQSFSMDDWVDSLKYLTNDGDVIIDSINSSKTTKTIQAKNLFIAGDSIDLTGKTISITSDNFQVTSEGNLTCKDATVRGLIDLYDQDTESEEIPVFNITGDGTVLSMSSDQRYMGWGDDHYGCVIFEVADKYTAYAMYSDNPHDKSTTISTDGLETTGTVTSTNGVCQGSLKELKKDFKELPSGLDIIRDIDIYKYKYKGQDGDKDHIGFVIADDYKYSKEVTNDKNDGVDLYSFVSVCCKAIQEQQKEIEELKEEINKLKKEE